MIHFGSIFVSSSVSVSIELALSSVNNSRIFDEDNGLEGVGEVDGGDSDDNNDGSECEEGICDDFFDGDDDEDRDLSSTDALSLCSMIETDHLRS